jgi:hypothetical protein
MQPRTRLALAAVAGGQTDPVSCAVCQAIPAEHEAIDHPLHDHVDPLRAALEPLEPPHHRCRVCGAVYALLDYRREYLVTGSGSEEIYRYHRLSPAEARALLA